MKPEEQPPVEASDHLTKFAKRNRLGAKVGALVSVIGAAVIVFGSMLLSIFEIPIMGYRLVMEGTVLYNMIGALISIAVISACGTVVGVFAFATGGLILDLVRLMQRRDAKGRANRMD
jgi:hypothetical protein